MNSNATKGRSSRGCHKAPSGHGRSEATRAVQTCYLHLSAHKLRELVKDKTRLSPEHLAAVDEAWFHTFGVLLVLQDCESVGVRETVLGVEQVLRMSNLSLTSLKRHVLDGTFPKPHRWSPDRIGWRPGDVSAWLHQRSDKHSGSTITPSRFRRPKTGWKALFRSARRQAANRDDLAFG